MHKGVGREHGKPSTFAFGRTEHRSGIDTAVHRHRTPAPGALIFYFLMDSHVLFGISVQGPYSPDAPRERHFPGVLESAIAARDAGFDFITTGQEYLTPGPAIYTLAAIPLLARLAADLPGMRIMTGVYLVPLDHPLRLVNDFATLDTISGGRLDIGMGLAYRKPEFENFGVDIKTRGRRFDEAIDVMRMLFTQDLVTYEGQFFKLHEARSRARAIQRPHPPFWIGGYSAAAVRRAAERGDGWYPGAFAELSVLKDQVALYRKTISDLGKPGQGQLMVLRFTWIDEDRKKAQQLAKDHAEGPHRNYVATGLRESLAEYKSRPWLSGHDLFVENWFAGNPDDIYEQIKLYIEVVRPDRFNFRVSVDPSAHADAHKAVRLLGREVLPRARKFAASLAAAAR
ncbi:MAG: LLM class flavin-dependent oxidoreductase [Betaproteobacteria bacterium]|nr:LLM class flavin-dependent oxidoreductase [Betaproteobacteria bacterium]